VPPSDTPEPAAPLPSDTPEPVEQPIAALPPTDTPLPTNTPTPTLTPTPETIILGGADKIAFVDDDEIWVMNIDGSNLQQLTTDGAQKTRLHWLPDGSAITYISGKCAWELDYQTGRQDFLACFESARYLDEFIVSNDGSRVAISVNLELFVVPFDRERLIDARSRSDLIAMGDCEILNPLRTNTGASVAVTQVHWSEDDTKLAIKVLAPQSGIQVDLIRYTDVSSCQYTNKLDEFPASRFHIDGYDKTPYIQNFGFDGEFLFAMNSYTRNDGYGYLYIYNTDLHRADSKITPVGNCCYRDPQFSPDGRYFIFAYQPFVAGAATQLYYVPYAQLTTGANFEPIPLPESFFTDPKVKPIPVLRPADGSR
jgi:dipeptidyl aminopeptidase/acylaminoacyl peptidase